MVDSDQYTSHWEFKTDMPLEDNIHTYMYNHTYNVTCIDA